MFSQNRNFKWSLIMLLGGNYLSNCEIPNGEQYVPESNFPFA